MKWNKQGLIFSPSGQRPWMQTHATQPIVLRLTSEIYRVYFSTRDEKNRSYVGYIEFDIDSPKETLHISEEPVLSPGPPGYFDDHGVYAGCLIEHEQKLYMYYIGWIPGATKPLFYSSLGLAVSDDGGKTFNKFSPVPIMTPSQYDPCTVLLPSLLKVNGTWRMWYGSGFKWEEENGSLHSYYDIKYAESIDGIHWQRDGLVCIGLRPGETNTSHPYVMKEADIYKMWYSYNMGGGYRIGYAESPDGYVWNRKDSEVGLELSASGWDSETVSHPHVFIHDGKKHMLYNGNGFGRDGFGIALETSFVRGQND